MESRPRATQPIPRVQWVKRSLDLGRLGQLQGFNGSRGGKPRICWHFPQALAIASISTSRQGHQKKEQGRLFILAMPWWPACISCKSSFWPGSDTTTPNLQSTHPSSIDSSSLQVQKGFNASATGRTSGHLLSTNCRTLDSTGSLLVHPQIWDAVTGLWDKPSTKQTISAGSGVLTGWSDNGDLLIASALLWASVGLNAISYSYMPKPMPVSGFYQNLRWHPLAFIEQQCKCLVISL